MDLFVTSRSGREGGIHNRIGWVVVHCNIIVLEVCWWWKYEMNSVLLCFDRFPRDLLIFCPVRSRLKVLLWLIQMWLGRCSFCNSTSSTVGTAVFNLRSFWLIGCALSIKTSVISLLWILPTRTRSVRCCSRDCLQMLAISTCSDFVFVSRIWTYLWMSFRMVVRVALFSLNCFSIHSVCSSCCCFSLWRWAFLFPNSLRRAWISSMIAVCLVV